MSAVPKPREQLRMMIVDDSNVMRRRIERSQQNDRLEVVGTAVNGLDAVTKFKQLMPDVMTLDLTMPEMSGRETMASLRQFDRHVRVLYMSGYTSDTLGESSMLGSLGFLNKPFTPKELAETVRKTFDLVKVLAER